MNSSTSPVDIRPDHLEIVQNILREHLPAGFQVWVLGSRANWATKDSSDLDLAVEGADALDYRTMVGLEVAFEESDLPYTVDVVDLNAVSPEFREIVKGQRVSFPLTGNNVRTDTDWPKVTLGSVCTKIGSGATPRGGKDVYLDEGPYTLIRSQNVYNDGFHRDGLAFIGEGHASELQNVEVFEEDVLLNITGDSVARVCQVAPDVLPARVNQHVAIIRPDSVNLDAGYLRYYLVSPEMQTLLLSWAGSGGTRNALTKGMIESLELPLPPLSQQCAIAHIFGALDDKIELNRRMNQTLEQMTQAIFQDWFVDFGPVRAKLEDREPYLPPELWDLFPHRLADSELGQIPEGWEFGCLGDVADFPMRSVSPADLAEETPYIGLEHMPRRSITLAEWGRANKVTSNKLAFQKGEFLFGKLRPYFHKVGVAPTDGICSTDIVVVAPNANLWSCLVLSYISTDEFVAYTDQTSTGTRMPRTNWKAMSQYEIRLPPEPVARAFQKITQHLLDRIAVNIHESHALAAQRDALLPKLVSGELRVDRINIIARNHREG